MVSKKPILLPLEMDLNLIQVHNTMIKVSYRNESISGFFEEFKCLMHFQKCLMWNTCETKLKQKQSHSAISIVDQARRCWHIADDWRILSDKNKWVTKWENEQEMSFQGPVVLRWILDFSFSFFLFKLVTIWKYIAIRVPPRI